MKCSDLCFIKIIMNNVWECIRGDKLEAGEPVDARGCLLDESW